MKYFFSFILMISCPPIFGQAFNPSLHLVKGDTYYITSTGNSVITQNIRGRENRAKINLRYTMAFMVTGLKDTIYAMEVSYRSIEMKIQMPDTTLEMNSEKSRPPGNGKLKPDTPSMMLAAMVNKPFRISLSTKGKVISTENLDKIILGVFNNFQQIDSLKKNLIKNQFMQSFGENAFKGSLEMGVAIFPNKAVAKKDVWTVNSSLSVPAWAKVKTVYQLADITGDFFQVHGEGTINNEDAKPGEINGLPAKYKLNGGLMADIKINRKTGWIDQLIIRQLIEGEIDIMDNPKMPGGTTIPMMFNTEVRIGKE